MKNYNTAINPLGSIQDINVIIETIKNYKLTQDLNKVKDEFINGNTFGFDISSSRKRFFAVIKKLFLKNLEQDDNQFFINSIASKNPEITFKKALIYLEVFRKNDLFQDIIKELIYKKYKENRRLITSNEVYEFLIASGEGTKIADWSQSTVKIIATKYISFMKRLGYFRKAKSLKSEFSFPAFDEKIISYLVYLLKQTDLSDNQIFQSDLFLALMLDKNKKIELLKEGSLAGYYKFSLTGDEKATIELNYKKGEIIDKLFR